MSVVRVKICGVTRPEDAELAAALGADLLGLNFFAGSPRYVEARAALEIADAVAPWRERCRLVGVFVDHPIERVRELGSGIGLDLLQFHGDEESGDLAPVAARAIKALRFEGSPDENELAAFPDVWGFLVEPRVEGYGGGGRSWDYEAAKGLPRDRPLLLAGGLGPENVRQAIIAGRPWGVDVCSGVEAAPGRKDGEKMKSFFDEVRSADG